MSCTNLFFATYKMSNPESLEIEIERLKNLDELKIERKKELESLEIEKLEKLQK